MIRFHTITVPIDFSERSRIALRTATNMAGPDGVVHAVHVLPPLTANEPGVIWGTIDDSSRMAHANAALREILENTGLDPQRAHTVVARGNPAHAIVTLARELESDLIVVPATGKTGLAALGSVAERVVRLASEPVLVLHGE